MFCPFLYRESNTDWRTTSWLYCSNYARRRKQLFWRRKQRTHSAPMLPTERRIKVRKNVVAQSIFISAKNHSPVAATHMHDFLIFFSFFHIYNFLNRRKVDDALSNGSTRTTLSLYTVKTRSWTEQKHTWFDTRKLQRKSAMTTFPVEEPQKNRKKSSKWCRMRRIRCLQAPGGHHITSHHITANHPICFLQT